MENSACYHGRPAFMEDGGWILPSSDMRRFAKIPEGSFGDEAVFQTLKDAGFFLTEDPKPVFHMVLITTSDCNLKCQYCFANAGDVQKVMTEDVAMSSIRYAAEKARWKTLSLAFFWGEPTMEQELIRKSVDYSQGLREEFALRELEYGITTNGVMSSNFLQYLIRQKFLVTLSADGPADIQNFQRPTKGGGDSSKVIERSIRDLSKSGNRFKIRVTVTNLSVNRMADIVHWLGSLGGKEIHFEPISISGRAAKGTDGVLGLPDAEVFAENLKKALEAWTEAGVKVLSSSFMNLANTPEHFCNGDTEARIAVTPTGEMTTCVEVQDPCHPAAKNFMISKDWVESWTKEAQKIVPVRFFSKRPDTEKREENNCTDCFAREICGGWCPVRNFHTTGSVKSVDPYRCHLIREMVPYVVRQIYQHSKAQAGK